MSDTILASVIDSPRAIMPTTAVPAAPMPVHTAYAGPTSRCLSPWLSSAKLISAHTAKPAVGRMRVMPWLCLSRTANPVSKMPAMMTINHAMTPPSPDLSTYRPGYVANPGMS